MAVSQVTCKVETLNRCLRACPGDGVWGEALHVVLSPVHLPPGSAQIVDISEGSGSIHHHHLSTNTHFQKVQHYWCVWGREQKKQHRYRDKYEPNQAHKMGTPEWTDVGQSKSPRTKELIEPWDWRTVPCPAVEGRSLEPSPASPGPYCSSCPRSSVPFCPALSPPTPQTTRSEPS